jgi:urease accessory protein UreF
MATKQTQVALVDPVEWLGNWHPLAEQLGSADGLLEIGAVAEHLSAAPVSDLPSLREFLAHYHHDILFPFEMPAIEAGHRHALGNELRELVALDQQLAGQQILDSLAGASRRVGQAQLQKLRPLHDQKFVRRYLEAVESGHAHGWHTLVYGLTLAIYSLPLRQGLLGYAHQITRSFIYSAARMLELSEHQCRILFDDSCAELPAGIELLLAQRVLTPVL